MENNFCPHCGKATKEEKSKDDVIDELIESFKNDDDGKSADKKAATKKPETKKA